MSTLVAVEDVTRTFTRGGGTQRALDGVSLTIEGGSFVSLVGPSGCGKSTLLNLIAGLIAPNSGRVVHAGAVVAGPRMNVGYLTQKDTLLPWRDVLQNIALPLEIRGVERAERERRAAELIERVGLGGRERAYPRELSGGMARRASLARMLIAQPDLLLLDEPFSALDAQLRLEMQNELGRLWYGTGRTVVFVTHDLDEAIVLGDRVVVLGPGGSVRRDETIALARPRDAVAVRRTPEYRAIEEHLWEALMTARAPESVA
ncbi:MAG TPA: ABC transporter ATP-binding protein [Candidatus Sulfotelmatobacter sp.]|nr:ABC transporter ATP-binding protein [Candidatus Sulfotelmatobacter sp.]